MYSFAKYKLRKLKLIADDYGDDEDNDDDDDKNNPLVCAIKHNAVKTFGVIGRS